MTSEFATAVHAMVLLYHKKTTLSSDALSKNICTHPARIRKVMSRLAKAGLVSTKEGIDGGYFFDGGSGGDVTLRQICDALDVRLVSSSWRSGSMDMKCMISSGMAGVMDGIYDGLDEECRKRLEHITVGDIERNLTNSGGKPDATGRAASV